MMRVLFALVLVLAAVAQATLLPAIGPVAVLPNVVLVLILVRSARQGIVDGVVWIVVAGVVLDTVALDPLGTNGLALLPVAVIGGLARRRWFVAGPAFPMVLAISATFAYAVALSAVRALAGAGWGLQSTMLGMTTLQALLNAVLVPPLYLVVGWLTRNEPLGVA